YRRHLDAQRPLETIAELDSREPHWRLEDLEADREEVPDAENSANVIRVAAARITRRTLQPGEELVDLEHLDAAPALTATQLREVIDWLESAESAIAPALALERFPRGRHPITYSADGIGTLQRHFDDMAQVNRSVLRPLLLLHLHEGDAAAAARDCVCIANLG